MIFKKKPIYYVGVVFFTLLLIADIAIYFLTPAGGRGNVPNFDSADATGSFDFGGFGGQRPDMGGDFNFEDFGGQMPDMGDFDFGDFGGQMPEMDGSNEMGAAQGGSFLTSVRSAFWPILIIALLGDGICIFMLVRISRKEAENEEYREVGDEELRRRGRVNIALAAVAGVLVIAVVLTSLPNGNAGATREAETAIQEATAEYAELVNVFSGSGTLQPGDATQMQIPTGVNILSYGVKNGETVNDGDALARVDKTSVQRVMYEVQTLLTELDAELVQVQDAILEDTVTAQAAGRVKAIYVAQGDSVAASVYQNGALLLISLGGSMTVEVESTASVTVGQSLTVTLSDGTQIEGKVQQSHSGKITVTTTDDGPVPGDTVTVADEDGNALGTGTLNVSSPLKVMTYSGTVASVAVSVNQEVEIGDVLLTLEDAQDAARYTALLDTRKSLTDLLQSLAQMYREGVIRAGSSGIIAGVDEDAAYAAISDTEVMAASGSSGNSRIAALADIGTGMPGMSGSGGAGGYGGENTQIPSGDSGFGMQTGGMEDEEDDEEATYTIQTAVLCTITPTQNMTIDISVDELDIMSLSVGQEAAITLDALPGQSFTGTVKKMDPTGTNEGGSTKYTVTVEVAKTQQMLIGMNASVRVEVSTLSDILTVPAAAVYEDGNRTYVYTAVDDKTGEPTKPVDVTTGSSDGESIEILSGLTSGDTVYYSYAESIVYRFVN